MLESPIRPQLGQLNGGKIHYMEEYSGRLMSLCYRIGARGQKVNLVEDPEATVDCYMCVRMARRRKEAEKYLK